MVRSKISRNGEYNDWYDVKVMSLHRIIHGSSSNDLPGLQANPDRPLNIHAAGELPELPWSLPAAKTPRETFSSSINNANPGEVGLELLQDCFLHTRNSNPVLFS